MTVLLTLDPAWTFQLWDGNSNHPGSPFLPCLRYVFGTMLLLMPEETFWQACWRTESNGTLELRVWQLCLHTEDKGIAKPTLMSKSKKTSQRPQHFSRFPLSCGLTSLYEIPNLPLLCLSTSPVSCSDPKRHLFKQEEQTVIGSYFPLLRGKTDSLKFG